MCVCARKALLPDDAVRGCDEGALHLSIMSFQIRFSFELMKCKRCGNTLGCEQLGWMCPLISATVCEYFAENYCPAAFEREKNIY